MNGDGALDLVATNYSNSSAVVLLGDKAGNFAAAAGVTTGITPTSAVIADVIGDSRPDLIVANRGSNTLRVYPGMGSFGTYLSLSTGSGPTQVIAADIDGDQKLDLASANYDSANLTVQYSRGGNFGSTYIYPVNGQPVALAAGELNRVYTFLPTLAHSFRGLPGRFAWPG